MNAVIQQPTTSTIQPGNSDEEEAVQLPPSDGLREDIIQSLTWEELTIASRLLAERKYRSQTMTPEKIASAVLFPQFLATQEEMAEDVLEDGAYSDLVVRPYLTHIKKMHNELVETQRQLQQKRNELASRMPHLHLDIVDTVIPSQWLVDFLFVFDRAKKSRYSWLSQCT